MAILSEFKYPRLLFALVALSVLDLCSPLQEDVFVLENKSRPERRTIVILTRIEEVAAVDCVTLTNKMLVEEIVSSIADYVLMKLSGKTIKSVLKECTTLSKRRERRESDSNDKDCNEEPHEEDCSDNDCDDNDCDEEDGSDDPDEESPEEGEKIWNIIFPGTKYCGNGDLAKDYGDLGILKDTDKCCRTLDYCNDTIPAGVTKHNLTNESKFTTLDCACDDTFYDCLSNVNSIVSNTIGRTYFNILKRSCFTKEYPLTNTCKTYRSFLKITCKEYARNTTVSKVYMWRSPKRYKKLPLPVVG